MTDIDDELDAEIEDDAAGAEREYISLDQALADRQIPFPNHDIIRLAVAVVGIERYTGTSSYIKAHRAAGGPVLRIAYGFTNGFVSREEALSVGNVTPWRSGRKRLWGIEHPQNSIRGGNTGAKRKERDYGVCDVCFTGYTPAGTCRCAG